MNKLFLTFALLETACFASEINHENLGATNNPTQNIEQNIPTNGNIQENHTDQELIQNFCNGIIRERIISEDYTFNIPNCKDNTKNVLNEILSFAQNSNNISKTVTKAFSDSIKTIFNPTSAYDQYEIKGKLVNALLPEEKQVKFDDEDLDKQKIINDINQKYNDLSAKVNFLLLQCYIEDISDDLITIEDVIENVIFYAEYIKLFNEGIDKKVQYDEYKNINQILVLYACIISDYYASNTLHVSSEYEKKFKNLIKKQYCLDRIINQVYNFVFKSGCPLKYILTGEHSLCYAQTGYNACIDNAVKYNFLYLTVNEYSYLDPRQYSNKIANSMSSFKQLSMYSMELRDINDDNLNDDTYFCLYKQNLNKHKKRESVKVIYKKALKRIKRLDRDLASDSLSSNIIIRIRARRGSEFLTKLKKEIEQITNNQQESQNNQQALQNQRQRNIAQRPHSQNNQQAQQNQRQRNIAQRPHSQNNQQTQQNQRQRNIAPRPQSQNNTQYSISRDQLLAENNCMFQTLQTLANMVQNRYSTLNCTSHRLSSEINGIKRIIDSDDAQNTQRRNTEENENHQN